MQRIDFLKNSVGMISLASIIPALNSCKKEDTVDNGSTDTSKSTDGCTLTDSETDGPYPLYNSRGSSIQRTNIADGKTGIPLNINITIRNVNDNCNVISNARVDIWHCDKDGYYSGYTNSGYLGTQNNNSEVFLQRTSIYGCQWCGKVLFYIPGMV